MNNRFLSRSHLPGLERLKARGLVCHLIRAIGHHIVRLACRSVTIMASLTACRSDCTWNQRWNIPETGVQRSLDHHSRKPDAADFVPGRLTA
jgi:hypothetical protein